MQTQPMGVLEHRETAREFLREADEYFRQGDDLQGAEKMWGAAAHAVIAVCQQRGWRHRSHPAMTERLWRRLERRNARSSGDETYCQSFLGQGFFYCFATIMFTSTTGIWILEGGNGQYFREGYRNAVERFVDRHGGDIGGIAGFAM